jgi:uncharacterized protein (DUF342 family)
MTQQIIDALIAKYNADIMIARANLSNYFNNSAAVGEHPNIVKECDKLLSKIADAEGKVESLRKIIQGMQKSTTNQNPIKSGNESSNNRK